MKTTIIQSVNEEPSGGDAIQYLAEKARVRDQLKEEDLKIRKEHQTLKRENMEVLRKQQMQMQ